MTTVTTHSSRERKLEEFMNGLVRRNPGEPEFHQAVREVAESVLPYVEKHPIYEREQILQRMTEPDRIIVFRVCWEDDRGNVRTNRGYRVQFNNAIGPYKGGLRFHPSVNLSILKFLGFEQIFKNSLTTLPLGGAKGGANFNPKGKSDHEVMRFCQSFMTELQRHLGPDTDVPAGDIGVGSREISYMFGQHKRLSNQFTGVLTGKGLGFGGSLIRTEATGYGCVYFTDRMLQTRDESIAGKTCVISGSGNVAQYTAEKALQMGAKIVTMSDSSGFVYDPDGIDRDKLDYIIHLKTVNRERISKYAEKYGCEFHADRKPWGVPCQVAFPSATENEIDAEAARTLLENGCIAVGEGANMPTTAAGAKVFRDAGILYGPSKAANAGGVAISGLEMTQNSMRLSWTRQELEAKLYEIMVKIHDQCVTYGTDERGKVDYVDGSNVAGFIKVADSMLAYGVM